MFSLIESQATSRDFSTFLRDLLPPSSSCFISCLKIEISDVRFPKCSCIWLSKRESLFIICLNCSRLRASDCLLSSVTALLERRFLLGDGVCCEDELDDMFSRSFLLDIRGCRLYRQILASMFRYQDVSNTKMTQKFNVRRTSRPQIYAATVTRLAAMIAGPKSRVGWGHLR